MALWAQADHPPPGGFGRLSVEKSAKPSAGKGRASKDTEMKRREVGPGRQLQSAEDTQEQDLEREPRMQASKPQRWCHERWEKLCC